jgi:hypothetical protein
MKFKEDRPLANRDAAVRRLLEIANGMEADQLGRIDVGPINIQFLQGGGSVEEYTAAVKTATARGYITVHPSGGHITFTQEGSDLFA